MLDRAGINSKDISQGDESTTYGRRSKSTQSVGSFKGSLASPISLSQDINLNAAPHENFQLDSESNKLSLSLPITLPLPERTVELDSEDLNEPSLTILSQSAPHENFQLDSESNKLSLSLPITLPLPERTVELDSEDFNEPSKLITWNLNEDVLRSSSYAEDLRERQRFGCWDDNDNDVILKSDTGSDLVRLDQLNNSSSSSTTGDRGANYLDESGSCVTTGPGNHINLNNNRLMSDTNLNLLNTSGDSSKFCQPGDVSPRNSTTTSTPNINNFNNFKSGLGGNGNVYSYSWECDDMEEMTSQNFQFLDNTTNITEEVTRANQFNMLVDPNNLEQFLNDHLDTVLCPQENKGPKLNITSDECNILNLIPKVKVSQEYEIKEESLDDIVVPVEGTSIINETSGKLNLWSTTLLDSSSEKNLETLSSSEDLESADLLEILVPIDLNASVPNISDDDHDDPFPDLLLPNFTIPAPVNLPDKFTIPAPGDLPSDITIPSEVDHYQLSLIPQGPILTDSGNILTPCFGMSPRESCDGVSKLMISESEEETSSSESQITTDFLLKHLRIDMKRLRVDRNSKNSIDSWSQIIPIILDSEDNTMLKKFDGLSSSDSSASGKLLCGAQIFLFCLVNISAIFFQNQNNLEMSKFLLPPMFIHFVYCCVLETSCLDGYASFKFYSKASVSSANQFRNLGFNNRNLGFFRIIFLIGLLWLLCYHASLSSSNFHASRNTRTSHSFLEKKVKTHSSNNKLSESPSESARLDKFTPGSDSHPQILKHHVGTKSIWTLFYLCLMPMIMIIILILQIHHIILSRMKINEMLLDATLGIMRKKSTSVTEESEEVPLVLKTSGVLNFSIMSSKKSNVVTNNKSQCDQMIPKKMLRDSPLTILKKYLLMSRNINFESLLLSMSPNLVPFCSLQFFLDFLCIDVMLCYILAWFFRFFIRNFCEVGSNVRVSNTVVSSVYPSKFSSHSHIHSTSVDCSHSHIFDISLYVVGSVTIVLLGVKLQQPILFPVLFFIICGIYFLLSLNPPS